MQSNTIRNIWLTELWKRLHDQFEFKTLPEDALVVCGHPSRQARGQAERRRPCEVTVGEWRGNPEEKAFVSVHPERFKSEKEVAHAILWGAGRAMYGAHGSRRWGLHKTGEKLTIVTSVAGNLSAQKLKAILTELGDLPSGSGSLRDEPKHAKQTTRMRKWVCPTHTEFIVRIASDTKGTELQHVPCGEKLVLTELHPSKKVEDV